MGEPQNKLLLVQDVAAEYERLLKAGYTPIKMPCVDAQGRPVAYVLSPDLFLFELRNAPGTRHGVSRPE